MREEMRDRVGGGAGGGGGEEEGRGRRREGKYGPQVLRGSGQQGGPRPSC